MCVGKFVHAHTTHVHLFRTLFPVCANNTHAFKSAGQNDKIPMKAYPWMYVVCAHVNCCVKCTRVYINNVHIISTRTHVQMHANTHTHTQDLTSIFTHAAHARTHVCTHSRTHVYPQTHTYKLHTNAHTHTHTNAFNLKDDQHCCIEIHVQAHTHTHTHTHTDKLHLSHHVHL